MSDKDLSFLDRSHNLFVYGTLIIPEIQQQVFGRIINGEPDSLEGFKKKIINLDGTEYPAIIPEAGSITEGCLLKITSEELERADIYETSAYLRSPVILKSGIEAFVYHILSKA